MRETLDLLKDVSPILPQQERNQSISIEVTVCVIFVRNNANAFSSRIPLTFSPDIFVTSERIVLSCSSSLSWEFERHEKQRQRVQKARESKSKESRHIWRGSCVSLFWKFEFLLFHCRDDSITSLRMSWDKQKDREKRQSILSLMYLHFLGPVFAFSLKVCCVLSVSSSCFDEERIEKWWRRSKRKGVGIKETERQDEDDSRQHLILRSEIAEHLDWMQTWTVDVAADFCDDSSFDMKSWKMKS
jgi:hypothetical protein